MIRILQEKLSVINSCRKDFKVLYYALATSIGIHVLFMALFWFFAIPQLIIVNFFSVIFYIYSLNLFTQSLLKNDFRLLVWLITLEVVLHAYFASYYMGLAAGFQYYILAVAAAPLIADRGYFFLSVLRLLFIIVAYLFLERWLGQTTPLVSVEQGWVQAMRYINISSFVLLSGSVSFAFIKATTIQTGALMEMATLDKLTGLNNRYGLSEAVEVNVTASQQNGLPLSMLIVDVDFFKEVNDQHGHLCGDYVLSEIAEVIQSVLRVEDVVGRWGGEEFMVLLPNTEASTLAMMAERLRSTIEHTTFSYNNKDISVSVTVGAATLSDGDSEESLTLRADQALYQGKRSGRNRYHFKAA